MVPAELDSNAHNHVLINAALAAGLYPKILSIDMHSGRFQTVMNNQPVSFHPSSVNFKKKLLDFGVNHLAFFTLMLVIAVNSRGVLLNACLFRHSKKLYAWETGPVDDISLLLLCGECDFKVG